MKWTIKCNRCGLSWNMETDGVTFPISDCPRCHDDTLHGLSVYAETPVTDECNQCGRTWTSVIVKNHCPYCGSTELVRESKDAVKRHEEIYGLQTIEQEKITVEEQGEIKPTQPISLPKQNDAEKKAKKSSGLTRRTCLTVFIPVFGLMCGVIGTFLAFFQVYPEIRPFATPTSVPTPTPTPIPCVVIIDPGIPVTTEPMPSVISGEQIGGVPKGAVVTIDSVVQGNGLLPPYFKISHYTYDSGKDVKIVLVAPNSPAERAGLQAGDIILQLDEKKITSYLDVIEHTNDNLGNEVTIQILRNGQQVTMSVYAREESERPEGQGAMGIQLEGGVVEVDIEGFIPSGGVSCGQ